jgi:hypothetical protein
MEEEEKQPLVQGQPADMAGALKVAIEDPRIRPVSRTSSVPAVLTAFFTHKTAKVLLAVITACSWMTVSSLLILVNKYILKDINYP